MRIAINVIAIILVVIIVSLQSKRTKNLFDKKFEENKDEFINPKK